MDLLPDLLGYRLRRAQLAVFQDFSQRMAAFGVTPGRFGVLAVIGANPGLSQSAVAEALGTERSTMVAIVDRFERDGWVVRRRQDGDRRTYALTLTAAGETLVERMKAEVRAHEARIVAGLSAAERDLLMRLLERVAR